MKKNYALLFCFALLLTNISHAQVGVGTIAPQGALDVSSGTNGILIPRVNLTARNVSAPVVNPNGGGIPIDGTLVWNLSTSGTAPNNVSPGFYYWQGTSWNVVGSASTNQWALLGNASTTAGTNFVGTTDAQDLRFKTNSADRFNISNAMGQLQSFAGGSVNGPTYSWTTSPNTGMFMPTVGYLSFATTGTEKMRIEPTGTVGVGTAVPNASALLDVSATNKGVLVPRVALTSKNAAAPVTTPATSLLVYNTATAGTTPNNIFPGFYYWNGASWTAVTGSGSNDWGISGNSGLAGGSTVTAGTNFIGTTDAQNLNFRTNNNYVGRFSSLGEFFVGTLNTVIPGDLMNAVGNATFPWAINGYTSQDGAGVYGSIQAGNIAWGGVQGEYYGSSANGNGTRGVFASATGGGSFAGWASGVFGAADGYAGAYKFGVRGSGGASLRSGGVIGYDFGLAIGALGYYASNGADYSVYGFGQAHTNGAAAGRLAQPSLETNTNIGLGIYGGVMGGWVRGLKYGFHTKGETYSLYVDGNGYVNKPLTMLMENPKGGERIPAYMSTSTRPEISVNGKTTLNSGKVFIAFDKTFSSAITNVDDIVITATPQGKSNGVYIDSITKEGFWIFENNEGQSNVKIAWIAITKIDMNESVPTDLLATDFDKKMDGLMFNENDSAREAQPLWWDGTKMRWDKPQLKKIEASETKGAARPREVKKN